MFLAYRNVIIFFFMLAASCASGPSSDNGVTPTTARAISAPLASIPYEKSYDGWYTVDVMMNGRGPYKFIVDTGATITAVFEKATQPDFFRETEGRPRKILGVTGARFVPPTYIGDISIGNLDLRDHTGVIIPDWDNGTSLPKAPSDATSEARAMPDGILGLDFLARYVLVFDTIEKRIDFYPADNPPVDLLDNMVSTPLKFSTFNQNTSGLYVMTVNISGRRIPSILDLGANAALVNYAALRRLTGGVYVAAGRTPGSNTGSNLKGVFEDEKRIRVVRTGPVKINSVTWSRRTLLIYSAGIFTDLGVHKKPFGLIGADMFADRHIAIDFGNEKFYLSKNPVLKIDDAA